LDFDVASNPEFLREGKALEDFFHPDRIVCGVESDRARDILNGLYRALRCPLMITDISTAELIKHAANAFLSNKISFINMVADLCEKVGADVTAVARGIGLDSRIGPQFLDAGIGYGGYCFPKDLRAFIYLAEEHGVDFSLLREVERINQRRVEVFLGKVRQALWVLRGKTIGILGLAFKPGTDDIREAVSLKIMRALLDEGSLLRIYDPQAMPNTQQTFPAAPAQIIYCNSAYEAAHGAQALLLLTEWEEFRQLDLTRVRDLMEVPVLVDGRNLYDPAAARQAGFEYISIGRGMASSSPGVASK
jgi:UDPglucose 6-dehydrogenase